MAWEYGIRLTIKSEALKGKTIKNFLKNLYADFTIKNIKKDRNLLTITYTFRAGAEIKDSKSYVNFIFKDLEIVDFKILFSICKEFPDYFEYMAKKLFNKIEPMPYDEFQRRVKSGEYWKDF